MTTRTWEVGEHVWHRGSKTNATILEVRPMPDNTYELRVEVDPGQGALAQPVSFDRWWASYHVEKGSWRWYGKGLGGEAVTP